MNGKPGDEPPPEKTPAQKTLEATPKEIQPYLKPIIAIYENQIDGKNTEIQTARKKADEYKGNRDLLQTQLNDKGKDFIRAKQELENADKWYNHWYVKIPVTLTLLTLGLFGGKYYETNWGQSGNQTQQINNLSSQLGAYQKEGTLEEFQKGKESKGSLVKENQKYKSENEELEQLKLDLQGQLSKSDKKGEKLTEDLKTCTNDKDRYASDLKAEQAKLVKGQKENGELQEKYKLLAKEHDKCKERIFVNVENKPGEELTPTQENMKPYMKRLAKELGFDSCDVGNIYVNVDANYDGKIAPNEQMIVDAVLTRGYKRMFVVATKGGWNKALELGIASRDNKPESPSYTLNLSDNGDIPVYEEADSDTKRAWTAIKAEADKTEVRTAFSRADFKELCDRAGANSLIGEDGVTISYNGNSIMAYWNKPKSERKDWNYFDVPKNIIYNIRFENWGEKECLKALKDYFSSIVPQKE